MNNTPPIYAHNLRTALGLSQKELSQHVVLRLPFTNSEEGHLSCESISRYENGKSPMPKWYVELLESFMSDGVRDVVVDFPHRIRTANQHSSTPNG